MIIKFTLNGDPAEVTPGPTLYCYNAPGGISQSISTTGKDGGDPIAGDHRFVVHLLDATHVEVDFQAGLCSGAVTMGASPTTYYR